MKNLRPNYGWMLMVMSVVIFTGLQLSGAALTAKDDLPDLAGVWRDDLGNDVVMRQEEENLFATAKENRGPVGWKKATGKFINNNTIQMRFTEKIILKGQIQSNGNRIYWANKLYWYKKS